MEIKTSFIYKFWTFYVLKVEQYQWQRTIKLYGFNIAILIVSVGHIENKVLQLDSP